MIQTFPNLLNLAIPKIFSPRSRGENWGGGGRGDIGEGDRKI